MTSKERVLAALHFQPVDRLPFNFWMDRRLMARYEADYGPDFRLTQYGADVVETFPLLAWPTAPGVDRDGSTWHTQPLLRDWADADGLELPSAAEDAVYDHINRHLYRFADKAILVNIPGPLTVLHGIRLMDNLFVDMIDHREELHRLIRRVMAIQDEVIERTMRLPVTALYFQDDVASSKGLMFSPAMVQEFVLDYFRRGIEVARNLGKPVIYHSDGAVGAILDRLVQMGINAVNPLQPDFNDFAQFKARYHGKLAVYGGIDNTKIIPDGTPQDIRDHIRRTAGVLGAGGGLILSSHDIPLHCPRENVEAMVGAIVEYRV